ncbi:MULTISPECIES: transglycosylase SLT domain-containing protein [unclassified Carboxylicivirga]|uniref:transglycosylase SLT domain-containing protein n=1 Tax=Carboxylicivirga TaxID=1628153 RepID=UPI003D351D51
MQRFTLLLMVLIGVWGCQPKDKKKSAKAPVEIASIDLDDIIKRGKIRVVTDYNSTNYFVYRGRPLGYQLELLQAFSNTLGLKLEIVVSNNVDENFKDLLQGEVDLIATNLTITRDRSHRVAFTEPHCETRQVLVQQTHDKNGNPSTTPLIRNQLDLAGKTIYVQENSAYVTRLKSLANEIGDTIHVVEIPKYEVEQLISLVASGEIPYTVCDENLARINLNFYKNIDVETAVSFPQKIAWAVRPNATNLKDVVDNWLISFKKTNQYQRIYRKYYINRRTNYLTNSRFHSIKSGRVSAFDALIKEESAKHNFDWRLVAALIYQESRFLPEVESWAGAVGLMQLMPQTAATFGVEEITSPQDNIQGGLKFLIWLDKRFADEITDPEERLKFVLASYNVGPGHVEDAMRLARKNNKNPYIWDDNVDYYLLNKSKPAFYNDPVVRHGYCRGEEPYHYVNDILERYTHYKNVIAD